jgi:hypothetical protein
MGTTNKGYPYPEGTDLVMDGDNAIKALADTINYKLPFAIWAGRVSMSLSAETKSVTVTLTPNFTGPPNVTIGPATAYPQNRSFWGVAGVTATSFQAVCYYAADADLAAYWVAVQTMPVTVMAPVPTAGGTLTVTCPTADCPMQGVPVEIAATWTDEDGVDHDVDNVECGACGTSITDTMTPGV